VDVIFPLFGHLFIFNFYNTIQKKTFPANIGLRKCVRLDQEMRTDHSFEGDAAGYDEEYALHIDDEIAASGGVLQVANL